LAKGLNAILDEGLLSVDVKLGVFLGGVLAEANGSLLEVLVLLVVRGVEASDLACDLLLEFVHVSVEVEEVGTIVASDAGHLTIEGALVDHLLEVGLRVVVDASLIKVLD